MQTTLIAVILTGAGIATPPPPPVPPVIVVSGGGIPGSYSPTRLTEPLTRAEWYQLLRGDERMNIEQREKLRLLQRMMEDDDLSLTLLL